MRHVRSEETMQTAKVVLGGKEFTVRELPARRNAAWRKAFVEVLARNVAGLTLEENLRLSPGVLGQFLSDVSRLICNGVTEIVDVLLSYGEELQGEAEWIKENAYESELTQLLVEVLKLAFPFGALGQWLRGLQGVGSATRAITRS
jgi:hypothetical protein